MATLYKTIYTLKKYTFFFSGSHFKKEKSENVYLVIITLKKYIHFFRVEKHFFDLNTRLSYGNLLNKIFVKSMDNVFDNCFIAI